MKNWYSELPKDKALKRDKHFKMHLIEPNSMITVIGGTGSGKTNSLIDFISRKNEAFHQIIIYSGSTTEEPLYQFLKQKMPEVEYFNDINEVPELNSFEDSKDLEKLIVFDDFINLPKKDMKKINEYLTSGRKFGFTVFVMAQNYTSIPKIVLRNTNYFIIFKLNETYTINHILKNYNLYNMLSDKFLSYYQQATKDKLNFFMIDMKNPQYYLRQNWLNIYPR
jgi:DNA helicase HerA-like ATPase